MSAGDPITRMFDGLASRIDAAGYRTVGFTSALLGEGVSTIALGTAVSLATLRQETVLLVDANWLQPTLTGDAHLDGDPGLAECLAEKSELHRVLRPASRARVAFLPVGDRSVARPALRGLSSFLLGVAPTFETVVVDLPPILAGESFVLPWLALLDQVVIVLRELATPAPVLRQALERLGTASPHVVVNTDGQMLLLVPLVAALVGLAILAHPHVGVYLLFAVAILFEQWAIPGLEPITAQTRVFQNISTYTPIPLRLSLADLLMVLTLTSWAARRLVGRLQPFRIGPLGWAVAAYGGVFLLGTVIGVARGGWNTDAALAEARAPFQMCLLYFLTANLILDRPQVV